MSLTLGPQHVATVPTVYSIASPVGLSIHLAGVPTWVARDVGPPLEYHRLGRIWLGNTLGYKAHIPLVTSPQLVYPLEPEYTLLSVSQIAGVTVTIDEIATSTTLIPKAAPYDRSPVVITQSAPTAVVGGNSGTLWTYTVPAGRMLLVESFELSLTRLNVWTTPSAITLYATRNGAIILDMREYANTVPYHDRTSLAGDSLILTAGEVLAATYADSSVGGNHVVNAAMTGYTFLV